MTFKTFILGGAAVAALIALASPSFAESKDSTPVERAQTNVLNSNAAIQARSDTGANVAAQDEYDAARAAYERSLNNYDARKAAYENDRARYEAQRHDYDRDRTARWGAFDHYDRYREVLSLHSADLVGLNVSTMGGRRIGRIRDVDYSSDGHVYPIAIDVGYHRIAWLYADDVRYDPDNRAVLIDLSRDQVDGLIRMRSPGS